MQRVTPFCLLAHLLTGSLAYLLTHLLAYLCTGSLQADGSEAGKYYAKVMAKVQGASDFVSKEIARLTKMKVGKSVVS